jgi:hypothetical protein
VNEPLIVLFKEKFFNRKSIGGGAFFTNSTGYFSGKFFFEGHSSGHTGSNDTGLEFISCLRAEKKGGHTDRFWVLYIKIISHFLSQADKNLNVFYALLVSIRNQHYCTSH